MLDNDVNVSASAPAEPTQMIPASAQLQAPAAAPAPAPAMLPAVQPITATSPNKHLMSLGARILGALAGDAPHTYKTDQDIGKMSAVSAPMSTGDKIKRIAQNALIGLSADSGPQRKSGLATGLAGIGAGEKAVVEKRLQEDTLARAHEKENFEQQQQMKLRKFEIARSNALTYATQLENEKRKNDLEPIYAKNESLFKAAKDSPELGVHAHEISGEQALQEAQKDDSFTHTHIIRPMGRTPVLDENGNQVMVTGPDGVSAPKMQMRYAVIDGTQDGKIKVTKELADDIQKYGSMARIPNYEGIKAGDTYSFDDLIPLMNRVDEQRKAVLEGWQKAELGWAPDPKDPKKEVPSLFNRVLPPGSPDSVRSLTVIPVAMKAEEAKSDLEKAQAAEAYGKGKEALANATLIAGNVPGNTSAIPAYMEAISKLPASSQAILRNVSPLVQAALLKLANGDVKLNEAFPTRVTKGSGQLDAERAANLAAVLNPSWTGGLYDTKKTAAKNFADGEDGTAIASFGQFFVHAADLKAASERVARTNSPLLNRPYNWIKTEAMGKPGVPGLMTAIQTTRSEWQTFVKNGHAIDLAESEDGRRIMSDKSSPAEILDAAREMGRSGIGRLDQIDAKWRRTWGGHYPGLISDSARQGATELGLGDQIKQYPAETGAMFGVQPVGGNNPAPPQNAEQEVYASDGKTLIGHVVNNKYVPLPK